MRVGAWIARRKLANLRELQMAQHDEVVFSGLIRQHYDAADLNGDGTLDQPEMFTFVESVFRDIGKAPPGKEALHQHFTECDLNKDGRIDFNEFYGSMLKLLLKVSKDDRRRSSTSGARGFKNRRTSGGSVQPVQEMQQTTKTETV
eukprot:TRINITY_DN67094_c11_g3_i1.p1 TRINITY_DN67094_c11_g3~~TRINITY_DN67094_c11_g3_i1.p1  ORF type:complete len:146 (-),score=17.72 TRINITY_DN67094_c11_g3_i1:457-894(-)